MRDGGSSSARYVTRREREMRKVPSAVSPNAAAMAIWSDNQLLPVFGRPPASVRPTGNSPSMTNSGTVWVDL